MNTATPLMRQYLTIKEQYPESILLFQVGDFYEIFFQDAYTAASILGIALTQRGEHKKEPIPLCGVPIHTVDHYLLKLVKAGCRVAICNQLSPPQPGTVVERDVTQVLTPGTLTDPQMLEDTSASYCASCFTSGESICIVFIEILTGHIFATLIPTYHKALLGAELARCMPDEVVISDHVPRWLVQYLHSHGYVTSRLPYEASYDTWYTEFQAWASRLQQAGGNLYEQSQVARTALYYIYAYLRKHNASALTQCQHIYWYAPDDFLLLDAATQRNLELVKNMRDGSRADTLCSILDYAATPMGSRTVKKWITRPLISRDRIQQRHDAVAYLCQDYTTRDALYRDMKALGDFERIVGRIALGKAHVHDYRLLASALAAAPEVRRKLDAIDVRLLERLTQHIADFHDLQQELSSALEDQGSDWIIRRGYDAELDRLRDLVEDASRKILELEQAEQERTGIASLKIRYNSVHGYVIEVTKPNLHLVPHDYVRVQTLVNRERFTMEKLRDIEQDMTHAHNTITQRQNEVYTQVTRYVAQYIPQLKRASQACAHIDALLSFARCAVEHAYVRPAMHDGTSIRIQRGRHPVVAKHMGQEFVPNDTYLTDEHPLWIITGPNMGGKSTFLRQTALIVVMAQAGAFIPAEWAELPIVDRIFTRIGAADYVAQGKSTFLVEMEETATICNQATDRSLVILDEVGRGTSTYDGYAIAQAVVEYIYTQVQARCLFATHYHELLALQERYPGMAAYHAASRQTERGITLLHKIVPGASDGSFGVEVARQAYLPKQVLQRADEILTHIKEQQITPASSTEYMTHTHSEMETASDTVTKQEHPVMHALRDMDVDDMSPKQALDALWRLKHDFS